MKQTKPIPVIMTLIVACGFVLATTAACDTPKSIAWSYYHCAADTLAAGDPYAAKHFLEKCKKTVDSDLANKADSLMEVIEEAIAEKEKKHS